MRQPGAVAKIPDGSIECCDPYPVPIATLLRRTSGTSSSPPNMWRAFADLVEQLVGGDPHEVCVHELHDRAVPAVQRDATGQAGEPVLADRGAEHPVRVGLLEALGRAVGAAVEAVDVLAHDDHALVIVELASDDPAIASIKVIDTNSPVKSLRSAKRSVRELGQVTRTP